MSTMSTLYSIQKHISMFTLSLSPGTSFGKTVPSAFSPLKYNAMERKALISPHSPLVFPLKSIIQTTEIETKVNPLGLNLMQHIYFKVVALISFLDCVVSGWHMVGKESFQAEFSRVFLRSVPDQIVD